MNECVAVFRGGGDGLVGWLAGRRLASEGRVD